MKKIVNLITLTILVLTLLISLSGCNYSFLDTHWGFNYAYISLSNGEILEIEIDKWAEDATTLTIEERSGNVYCVSPVNCIMTTKRIDIN